MSGFLKKGVFMKTECSKHKTIVSVTPNTKSSLLFFKGEISVVGNYFVAEDLSSCGSDGHRKLRLKKTELK